MVKTCKLNSPTVRKNWVFTSTTDTLYLTWIVAKATKFIYTDSSQLSSYIMSPSAQSSVASSVIQYMPKSLPCAAGPTAPCLLFLWLFETLSFSLTQLVPLPFLQHLKCTRCTLTTGHLHQLFILADMLIAYQQSVSVWLISSPSFSLHSNKTSLVRISLITHVKFGNFSILRLSISLPWFIFLHHISLFLISIYSICFLSLSLFSLMSSLTFVSFIPLSHQCQTGTFFIQDL